MIDHFLGRPSNGWKRSEVLFFTFLAYSVIKRYGFEPPIPWLRRWNRILSSLPAWKLILGTLTTSYVLNHAFLLLFLNAPEPLSRMYTRNFYRAAWIVTATDAGFLTAHTIRPKFLRDILSVWFSIFYLFNFDKADAKMKKYHAAVSIEMLRAKWDKKLNPYLQLLALPETGFLKIRRTIHIPRPTDPPTPTVFTREKTPFEPVRARLLFNGSELDFKSSTKLIFSIPGGGFCSMPPAVHEDYLSGWTRRCKVPIVSIDYDKCPEKPYPWQLEQVFDAYRAVVETNGACIGMEGWFIDNPIAKNHGDKKKPISIVLVGDSAGGNLCTALCLKLLDGSTGIDLRLPNGLVVVYPAYNMDPHCWLPNQHRALFRSASTVSAPLSSVVNIRGSIRPDEPFSLPPAPKSIDVLKEIADRSISWYQRWWNYIRGRKEGPRIPSALTMTSHMSYFTDLIMPPEILRAISLLLLGTSPVPIRFDSDYLLSPICAPEELLARFPKVHFICGEKDPFIDDMIVFGEKVRHAKMKAFREWERMKEVRELNPIFSKPTLGGSRTNSTNEEDAGLTMLEKRRTRLPSFGGSAARQHGMRPDSGSSPSNQHVPHRFLTAQGNTELTDEEFAHHIYHHDPSAMVHMKILEGCSHGFLMMLAMFPEARPAVNLCADWLTEMLDDEELGHTMTTPGSFTDLTVAAENANGSDTHAMNRAATRKKAEKRVNKNAEALKSGSVDAEKVLERRRATLAEAHDILKG